MRVHIERAMISKNVPTPTADIRPFTTQSRTPLMRWRCTYDDDDPDMIWAALGTLMQTGLRSGYDLLGDICPDHIKKYMFRPPPIPSSCPSVPWVMYTLPCIWFILYNRSFSSNRLSWYCYPDGGAWSAELIALSAKQIEQIISKTDQKIAFSAEEFGASSGE